MSYWFHPVDDSRNYTVSRIPEWFQIFGGLDYLRTSSKPWSWCGAYSFNCVFTLCTKRTPIICKKKWMAISSFVSSLNTFEFDHCVCDGHVIYEATRSASPLFFFSIAHTSEWVGKAMTFWQAWDTQKENGLSHFLFFCFDSYDLPPPSHYSHPDGCRCHSHRLENYSSYFKKKLFWPWWNVFSFFFEEEERRKLWSPLPFGKAYLPTPTCSFVPPFFSLVRGGR